MNEFKRTKTFVQVVKTNNFSEAARQLGIAKSAVSGQISALEEELGVRLLNRTTRKLSTTEAGDIYYQHCLKILQQAEQAQSDLRLYQSTPSGHIKITSPISFGNEYLVPAVKRFKQHFPQLSIELLLEDRIINMVEEGIDLSIRIGWMQQSNLVAKKICDSKMLLIASPDYLTSSAKLERPEQLTEHEWIALTILPSPLRWKFQSAQGQHQVQMNSSIKSNSVDTVAALVESGQGVTALAQYVVDKELETGELVEVLPEYKLEPVGIYAVYPHREHVPPKVRIFIDYLTETCRDEKWSLT